ncbi:MAG: hypothetical protein ACLSVX_15630 [Massilimicrobiota timonensis]
MREYVKPMMDSEIFASNEYCSTCGDVTTYLFTCDAGGGASGNVYVESNGIDGLQTSRKWIQTGDKFWEGYWQSADDSLGGYHACGTQHPAESTDDFLNGYYVPYGSKKVTDVIIWTGPNNKNVHCTTNLDQNTWPVAKS